MRGYKPSVTARHVAITRATFSRPVTSTGDAEAEKRLYRTLGRSVLPRTTSEAQRMERRTLFFDTETLSAFERGTNQVVIVGAGYDGRPLRFAKPGVRWFEVDHPATQTDKRRRLHDAGVGPDRLRDIAFIPVDLTKDDLQAVLSGEGYDPSRPSLFVVEGLIGYLPRGVTADLLGDLRALAAPGSRLAVAFPTLPREPTSGEMLRLRLRGFVVALVGEPWLVRYGPDEPDEVLRSAGWVIGDSVFPRGGPARHEGRQGVLVGAEPAP